MKRILIFLIVFSLLPMTMAGFVKNSCFFVENIPLGVKVDLSKSFYVCYENGCGTDVLYSFSVVNVEPSKDLIGSGFKNLEGKEDLLNKIEPIPDVDFVRVYPEQIVLHPHEIVKLKVIIGIPKKKEYYGRVWEFGILAQRKIGNYVFEEVTRNQIVTVNDEEQNALVIKTGEFRFEGYDEFHDNHISTSEYESTGSRKFTVIVVACLIITVVVYVCFIGGYMVKK